jgi:ribose transport system permease protein
MGLAFVVVCGLANGVVVAFAEIPPVFTTLAMGSVIFGVGNAFFFSTDTHNAPQGLGWLHALGYGSLLGVPVAIWAFGLLALLIHGLLRHTRLGRSIYALGDNPQAARLTGFPVRPITVALYIASGLIAYVVALMMVASNDGMNTRLFYTTLVYDVLLVVVLGGIGLGGGRGGVRNVLVGTLLVGTLTSGMTIMDLSNTAQNLIKSLVMLMALVMDTLLNPRDEQTSQQGDI